MESAVRKKRVLYHSDFALAKTGFGKIARNILGYLHGTGKYDLMAYCCGMPENSPALEQTPWKSEATIPTSPAVQQRMQQDPNFARIVSYGSERIDHCVQTFKPDVLVMAQDPWSFDYVFEKQWLNKITPLLWTTLDSLPILPSALEKASKIKNYWVWASFAEKAMKKLGHSHIKTVPGGLETKNFYRLDDSKRKELRKKFNIDDDCFCVISLFRNQLRKLVPNMLQGFAEFKRRNPGIKAKLIFHTHLSEGWQVARLAKEYGVDYKDILVTYICRNCNEYEVKSFDDRATPHEVDEQGRPRIDKDGKFIEKPLQLQDKDCKYCGAQKAQITTNVALGVGEKELNEIYNLADCALFAFTSGGMEIGCYEAKLTELPTLITNYSCGEDLCETAAYSLPLDYSTYWEHGTEFEKASTYPSSIAKQLDKVYKMKPQDRRTWGRKAREWVINRCSIEVIGKIFEDFIDNAPFVDENDPKNFMAGEEKQWNPQAQLPPTNSDEEFVKAAYWEILDAKDVEFSSPDLQNWVSQLKNGLGRDKLENTFRNIAAQELQKKQTISIEDLLDKNGKKRFLLVCKESAGDLFCLSSILESLKHSYLDTDIYLGCDIQYFDLFNGNPHIHKLLAYAPWMESELYCTGQGKTKGYFDYYCFATTDTQRHLSYLTHNKINLKLQ